MINYVEFLRASRAFRIIAIILGIVLVFAAVARIWMMRYSSWDDLSTYTTSPTAHVSKVQLPGGITKTIIDDPVKHVHAEITDRGYNGKQIVVTEPAHGSSSHNRVTMGSVNVEERSTKNGVQHTVIDTNADTNVKWLFVAALPLMLLFATLVAGPLSKENDGHFELALTKPMSRMQYALSAFAVDIVGIVATALLCAIVYTIICSMFQVPHFMTTGNTYPVIALCFLSTIGFYALVTAVSASIKRGPGAAIGITWAAVLVVPGLSHIDGAPGTLPAVIGGFFRALNRINPINYMPGSFHMSTGEPILNTTLQLAVLISLALIIAYLAAALLQWRRVEA